MTAIDTGISIYNSELLNEPGVKHAFLGRYENQRVLDENIKECFGVGSEKVITIDQVHGDSVLVLDELKDVSLYKGVEGDAIVTALKNTPIAVRTADCLPILLYDPLKKAIGVVHAGWKSTVKMIAIKAIEAMAKEFGSLPENITAVIGPAIGPCCYIVGPELLWEFENAKLGLNAFTITGNSTKLDLALANADQLVKAGLKNKNISSKAPCTSCIIDLYYSYRVEGEGAGRELSIIMTGGSN